MEVPVALATISPYLQAIQSVAGTTPGEKYKTLNCLAKRMIKECKDLKSIKVEPSEELPELFVPLIKLEIAKLLKKPDGIIEALRSDDQVLFNRALKTKWYFNGTISNHPNALFFQDNIFPFVSLNNRTKLIRTLAKNLALDESTIAESFYISVSEMYGNVQAQPFLKACSESFIWDTVIERQIVFNIGEIKYLFLKYPKLVIEYLELSKPDDNSIRDLHKITIMDYVQIFPRLLKKFSHNFVNFIQMCDTLKIELGNYHTDIFLKNESNTFILNSQIYIDKLSLKRVTRRLSRLQFEAVFQELLPKKIEDFESKKIMKYLEFIPDNEKIPIMMSAFQDAYKVSLLDCTDKIEPEILILLPKEERIKQAKKKLETDDNWYLKNVENMKYSWRCYLSIDESIPLMQDKILECEDSTKFMLLNQLVYTCKINNDLDALFSVMKYVFSELGSDFWRAGNFMLNLFESFKNESLPAEHIQIMCDFVRSLKYPEVRRFNHEMIFKDIIISGIRHDLDNKRSITKKISYLIERNSIFISWNIITDIPSYESTCLNEFANLISIMYPKAARHSQEFRSNIIKLVKAIYFYNKRCSEAIVDEKVISVAQYPWLLDAINEMIKNDTEEANNIQIDKFKHLLQTNEPVLFPNIVNMEINKSKEYEVIFANTSNILKKNPTEILDNFAQYFLKCTERISCRYVKKFIKSCLWFANLPMKFIQESFKAIHEKNYKGLRLLATMLKPSELESTINLLFLDKIIKKDLSNHDYSSIDSLLESFKVVNSPLTLDFVMQYTDSCYFSTKKCHQIVLNLGRRVVANKVLPFCEKLDSNMGVNKYKIQMFSAVATVEDLQKKLKSWWEDEKMINTRYVLIKHIYKVFLTQPCLETWEVLNESLNSLVPNDSATILRFIEKYDKIPNEYIVDYIKKLFIIIEKIGENDDSLKPFSVAFHVAKLLKNLPVNIAVLFNEKTHKKLLKSYLINLSHPKEVISAAQRYLNDCYLLPAKEKFTSRLGFFLEVFQKMLTNEWDTLYSENYYPANYFVHELIENTIFRTPHSKDKVKLINTTLHAYLSVLRPEQAPEFFCNFSISALYDSDITPIKFTNKLTSKLPSLISIFSSEFLFLIAQFLYRLIDHFYNSDAQLDVMKRLLGFDNNYTNSLAAALLLCQNKNKSDKRLWEIVRILRKHRHPVATSSAYMAMVNSFFNNVN